MSGQRRRLPTAEFFNAKKTDKYNRFQTILEISEGTNLTKLNQ